MKIKIKKDGCLKDKGSNLLDAASEYLDTYTNEYETFSTPDAILWLQSEDALIVVTRGRHQEHIKAIVETFDKAKLSDD